MREDMFKVIVERPRHGRHSGVKARKRLTDDGDLPVKIGVNRHLALTRSRSKSLNENLNPLKRYLRTQVGRPWNKVYSEICATLAPGHTVKEHVRQHIDDYVVRNISVGRNGEWLSNASRFFGARSVPWYQPFYVDPSDGILKDSAKLWKKLKLDPKPWRRKAESDPDIRRLDDVRDLRRIDGVWYEIGFDKQHFAKDQYVYDPEKHGALKGVPGERWIFDLLSRSYLPPHWRHAIAKRQLSGLELKAHGLVNETKE